MLKQQFKEIWNKMSNKEKNIFICKQILKWRQVDCDCSCGGKQMWVKPLREGGKILRLLGCVCHCTPNFVERKGLALFIWNKISKEKEKVAALTPSDIAFESLCVVLGIR